jgi:diaminohydroxyphosphoribosylaminopyrimidine deaminase/5-amino-6-(5-phosphoribosylamino)uracil reductase
MSDLFDRRMMERAITLARRSEGRVEPDPMVGCVIVRKGRMIGEGFHRRFGGPHAEIEALRACAANPRGATVYVSLEPCCHPLTSPSVILVPQYVRPVAGFGKPGPSTSRRNTSKYSLRGHKCG